MDRLSELAYSITPYRFAFNNPVFFGDPTGLIEMSMLRDMFNSSQSGETWRNDNNGGFYSDNGGSVDHNGSNFTAPAPVCISCPPTESNNTLLPRKADHSCCYHYRCSNNCLRYRNSGL